MKGRGNSVFLTTSVFSAMMGFYQYDALIVGVIILAGVICLVLVSWLFGFMLRAGGRRLTLLRSALFLGLILLLFVIDPATIATIAKQPAMWFVASAVSFIVYGLSASRRT